MGELEILQGRDEGISRLDREEGLGLLSQVGSLSVLPQGRARWGAHLSLTRRRARCDWPLSREWWDLDGSYSDRSAVFMVGGGLLQQRGSETTLPKLSSCRIPKPPCLLRLAQECDGPCLPTCRPVSCLSCWRLTISDSHLLLALGVCETHPLSLPQFSLCNLLNLLLLKRTREGTDDWMKEERGVASSQCSHKSQRLPPWVPG